MSPSPMSPVAYSWTVSNKITGSSGSRVGAKLTGRSQRKTHEKSNSPDSSERLFKLAITPPSLLPDPLDGSLLTRAHLHLSSNNNKTHSTGSSIHAEADGTVG